MSEEPLVSPEEVEKVLDAGGEEESTEAQGPADGDPYSLRRPVPFVSDQFGRARERFEELAVEVGESLAAALGMDVTAQARGFEQRQVGESLECIESPAWVLAIGAEGRAGIAVAMDAVNALAIVELTMGGSGTYSAAGRAPTALESRVMLNLAGSLREQLEQRLGLGFDASLFRVGRVPRRLLAPQMMVGSGRVTFAIGNAERSALLLASPGLLRLERDDEEESSDDAGHGPLAEALTAVELSVRPMLEGGRVSLRRLYELRPDSILSLTTDEGTPLKLCVNERPLFEGSIRRTDSGAQFDVAVEQQEIPEAAAAQEESDAEAV